MRTVFVLLLLSLMLAACSKSPQTGEATGGGRQGAAARSPAKPGTAPQLAYSHRLAIETAPSSVAPRFQRARDACLAAASSCILPSATIQSGDAGRQLRPYASLVLRLPHDAVEPFIDGLLQALPGETGANAVLRSRSTTADDLTEAIADGERRLKQLMDYRERLTALAARPDAKLDELIKVESELSTVQSQIETLVGQQHALGERVATERLDIEIYAEAAYDSIAGPIGAAWQDARGAWQQHRPGTAFRHQRLALAAGRRRRRAAAALGPAAAGLAAQEGGR